VRRRAALGVAGAAIVVGYVATTLLTGAWSGRQVRPLFEGVGPAQPYQWVKPPPQFAATNVAPRPGVNDIPFVNGQTPAAVAATPDGQFIVNFSAKAFPAHTGDTSVHVITTPLDPSTLGPMPANRHADGNAYKIEYAYAPSKAPVGTLNAPADVIMNAPSPTVAMLYSSDGVVWKELSSQQVGGPSTVGASFAGPGYYLAASSGTAPKPANAGGSGGGTGTVLIAVVVAAVAAGLGGLALVLQRRRRAGVRSGRAAARAKARDRERRRQAQARRRPPR